MTVDDDVPRVMPSQVGRERAGLLRAMVTARTPRSGARLGSAAVDATEGGPIVLGMMTRCQIRQGGEWVTVTYAEAMRHQVEPMRCPRCHGEVHPHDHNGADPHFAHVDAHHGCKAEPPVLHPDALR